MTVQEWINIFGDNLAEMLKDARMTQQELADAAGISESIVSDYINKRRGPCIKSLINISLVMSCSLDELMDFEEIIE